VLASDSAGVTAPMEEIAVALTFPASPMYLVQGLAPFSPSIGMQGRRSAGVSLLSGATAVASASQVSLMSTARGMLLWR